jgi:hypothetical protein
MLDQLLGAQVSLGLGNQRLPDQRSLAGDAATA